MYLCKKTTENIRNKPVQTSLVSNLPSSDRLLTLVTDCRPVDGMVPYQEKESKTKNIFMPDYIFFYNLDMYF